MTSTEHLIGFIIAAVLTPTVILGGISLAYFLDKRRGGPPKSVATRPTARTATLARLDLAEHRARHKHFGRKEVAPSTRGRPPRS